MPTLPAYDLLVLIDADAPEERRGQILDAIKQQIASGSGDLKGDVDWGVRKLAFEIAHRGDAYYHLFQLEAAPELLKQLEHSLAIDDAVLRHRIIRLPKGAPEHPPRPAPTAARSHGTTGEDGAPAGDRGSVGRAPAEGTTKTEAARKTEAAPEPEAGPETGSAPEPEVATGTEGSEAGGAPASEAPGEPAQEQSPAPS